MDRRWWPAPEAGEIVWCHFLENRGIEPERKPRPALVVKVFDDDAPRYTVLIAYGTSGTSQKTGQLFAGEFLIAPLDRAAYKLAGLSYPTKFNFEQTVELPYNEEWFKVPPASPHGHTPKLGVLHPSLVRRASAAWAAVQR